MIDRFSLVTRHNVVLHSPDTLGSLSVGNGEFAFTVDASGLQTFPEEYKNGIPLGTQSQWAWHSNPQKKNFNLNDVAQLYESCDSTQAPYAVQHVRGRAAEASKLLRSNPHRLHLGFIGLILLKKNGEEVKLEDLKAVRQELDLWTGKIESRYEVDGTPVHVTLYAHQREDGVAVKIESPLIRSRRLRIKIDFPNAADCHTCPGYDWRNPKGHESKIISRTDTTTVLRHHIDTTAYFAHMSWRESGELTNPWIHRYEFIPGVNNPSIDFTIVFKRNDNLVAPDFNSTKQNSTQQWKDFWMSGGAIDFSGCSDVRAPELERRVILSQYLSRIQCSGSLPPQETGLTMNSWYGKFHLEMHWWHAAHFALWNRGYLLEKSMTWYSEVTPKAKSTAKLQGYDGARWQKMTDPSGDESPSNIGAFIIWQQPHPIFLSELIYRNKPATETLNKYKNLVFNTADFMVSFLKLRNGKYHLCHPIMPAQEIFDVTKTNDPAFELQYWYYGIHTAQQWRKRLGMEENRKWKDVLENLAPLTIIKEIYSPNDMTELSEGYRNDHPAVLAAYGFLPLNSRVDTTIMNNTFQDIIQNWNWDATWGWDYPLLAMTATRLNKPEQAIEILLKDVQKNSYLVNGHNYQNENLRLYLPGNGGLLAAVSMMAAGWDGAKKINPGFPKNGTWNVTWEGLKPMP